MREDTHENVLVYFLNMNQKVFVPLMFFNVRH